MYGLDLTISLTEDYARNTWSTISVVGRSSGCLPNGDLTLLMCLCDYIGVENICTYIKKLKAI